MKPKITGNIWNEYRKGKTIIISFDAVKQKQRVNINNMLAKQIRDNIPIKIETVISNWSKFCSLPEYYYEGFPPIITFPKPEHNFILIPTKFQDETKVGDIFFKSLEQLHIYINKPENKLREFVIPYIGSNTGNFLIKDSREILESVFKDSDNIQICDLSLK